MPQPGTFRCSHLTNGPQAYVSHTTGHGDAECDTVLKILASPRDAHCSALSALVRQLLCHRPKLVEVRPSLLQHISFGCPAKDQRSFKNQSFTRLNIALELRRLCHAILSMYDAAHSYDSRGVTPAIIMLIGECAQAGTLFSVDLGSSVAAVALVPDRSQESEQCRTAYARCQPGLRESHCCTCKHDHGAQMYVHSSQPARACSQVAESKDAQLSSRSDRKRA